MNKDNIYTAHTLHTVYGTSDLIGAQYNVVDSITRNSEDILRSYGYEGIATPSIEYRQLLEIADKYSLDENYSLFDSSGQILSILPDSTIAVARAYIENFINCSEPKRLYYKSRTLHNYPDYLGRNKESYELGCEYLSQHRFQDYDKERWIRIFVEAEQLKILVRCLEAANIKNLQITIGHIGFFNSIIDKLKISDNSKKTLRHLINEKKLYAIEDFIKQLKDSTLDISSKEHFSLLLKEFKDSQNLIGDIAMLKRLQSIDLYKDKEVAEVLSHLIDLYSLLEQLNISQYITFDLGMLSKHDYYTGIIFKAYMEGSAIAVAKGGRYDSMIQRLCNSSVDAIGFVINIDELSKAAMRSGYELSNNKSTLSFASGCTAYNLKKLLLEREEIIDKGGSVVVNIQ